MGRFTQDFAYSAVAVTTSWRRGVVELVVAYPERALAFETSWGTGWIVVHGEHFVYLFDKVKGLCWKGLEMRQYFYMNKNGIFRLYRRGGNLGRGIPGGLCSCLPSS